MATNSWLGNAGNWSDGTKWSKGHKPETDEDILFDTGSGTCTVDETPATGLASFVINGFTGTVNFAGYAFNVVGTVNMAASAGARNNLGVFTQTGDADFYLGTTATYSSTTNFEMILQGTGSLTVNKNLTFKKLTCAASGKTTTLALVSTTTKMNSILLGAGTLTLNASLRINAVAGTGVTVITTTTGYTINGNAGIYIYTGASTSINIPALTMGGTTILSLEGDGGDVTYEFQGTLSLYNYTVKATSGDGSITINTNNVSITVSNSISIGNNSLGKTVTYNAGSSAHTTKTFTTAANNNYGTQFNMSTSTWSCSDNWTWGSNTTIDPGTSQITFTSGNNTFTTAGKTVYDVVINKTGTCTCIGNLGCRNLTITAGNWSSSTYTVTMSGNFSYAGSGTLNIGAAAYTLTGATSSATFSGTGTHTTATSIWVFQGAANAITLSGKSFTIGQLQTKTAGQIITWNTGAYTLTIAGYTAADWGGTAGNLVEWKSSSAGTYFNISAPAGVTVSYMKVTDSNNSGTSVTANNSIDGGHNVGWTFPSGVAWFLLHQQNRLAYPLQKP